MRLGLLFLALAGCKKDDEPCTPSNVQGFLTLTIESDDVGPDDELYLPLVWTVCEQSAGTAIMTQLTQTFTPPSGEVHGAVDGGTFTPPSGDPVACGGTVDAVIPENGEAEEELVLFCPPLSTDPRQ
jgi:hypothetical protein